MLFYTYLLKLWYVCLYQEITYRSVVWFINIYTEIDNSVGDSHAGRLWINTVVIPLSKSRPIALQFTALLIFPPNQSASYKLLGGQNETNRVFLYSIHKTCKKCDKRALCDVSVQYLQLDVKDTTKEILSQQCYIPCELFRPGRGFNSNEVKLDLTTLSSSVGSFF